MGVIATQFPVRLGFDPAAEDDTRECFKDDVARTLWLLWKPWHLVNQHYGTDCLRVAARIRENRPTTADELRKCFSFRFYGSDNFYCTSLPEFCELALPYFTGKKTVDFEVCISTPN